MDELNVLLNNKETLIKELSYYENINYDKINDDKIRIIKNNIIEIDKKIKSVCNHNYFEDEIEIFDGFTERIKKIIYCDKCGSTF